MKLGNPQEFNYGEQVPEHLLTDPIKPVCLGNTNIERIRSGLFCVHSQWEQLQMKDNSFSEALASSKDWTLIFWNCLSIDKKMQHLSNDVGKCCIFGFVL
jgi:hypothetical protein